MIKKVIFANSADPDLIKVHTVYLYAKIGFKSLQEYSALNWQSHQLSSALSDVCHLLVIKKVIFANSVDPDQTAPLGAVRSRSTLFACMQK